MNSAAPAFERIYLADAAATVALGKALGKILRAGDLVVLTGDLGAGKTTLTVGLGETLGVRGPITSPTFTVAREHPSLQNGPSLVHADVYRMLENYRTEAAVGSAAYAYGLLDSIADLELEVALENSVVVAEWGSGLEGYLSSSWVRVDMRTVLSGENHWREALISASRGRLQHECARIGDSATATGLVTDSAGQQRKTALAENQHEGVFSSEESTPTA